jgi:hypothetical protein
MTQLPVRVALLAALDLLAKDGLMGVAPDLIGTP